MAAAWMDVWWMVLGAGLMTGLLSGFFGVGGGIIMVPALVLIFAMPQKSAQAMSLAVMIPVALLGVFRYWRMPQVEMSFPIFVLLAAGGLVGTLVSTGLAGRLSDTILQRCFGVLLITVGIRMLWKSMPHVAR